VGKPVIEPDSIKIGGSAERLLAKIILQKKQISVHSDIVIQADIDTFSNIICSQTEVRYSAIESKRKRIQIQINVKDLPEDKEVLLTLNH
jgi:lipoate-protein ligase A